MGDSSAALLVLLVLVLVGSEDMHLHGLSQAGYPLDERDLLIEDLIVNFVADLLDGVESHHELG